jgi:hypothetical protein
MIHRGALRLADGFPAKIADELATSGVAAGKGRSIRGAPIRRLMRSPCR